MHKMTNTAGGKNQRHPGENNQFLKILVDKKNEKQLADDNVYSKVFVLTDMHGISAGKTIFYTVKIYVIKCKLNFFIKQNIILWPTRHWYFHVSLCSIHYYKSQIS